MTAVGKTVRVEPVETDRYGRTVARIAEANRITFPSAEAARRKGRSQAKDCR